jgi:hypothetical protein
MRVAIFFPYANDSDEVLLGAVRTDDAAKVQALI